MQTDEEILMRDFLILGKVSVCVSDSNSTEFGVFGKSAFLSSFSSWFESLLTSLCSIARFSEQLWIFLKNTFAVTGYKIWLFGISQKSGSFAALRLIWQGWARAPCLSTGSTSDLEDKHGVEAEDTHTHSSVRCAVGEYLSSVIQTQNTRNSTENTRGTFHTAGCGSFSRAKLAQHVQPECHVTRNSVCGASTCSGSLTHAGRTWRLRLQVNGLWSPEQEKVKETRTHAHTHTQRHQQAALRTTSTFVQMPPPTPV